MACVLEVVILLFSGVLVSGVCVCVCVCVRARTRAQSSFCCVRCIIRLVSYC